MSDELLFSAAHDDDLLFNDDNSHDDKSQSLDPWLVAIIDDDQQVHDVTVMALQRFKFAQRQLKFIHGYSAKEAIELFEQHDDIAVCLLDVVMESEYAGLEATKVIRESLNNHFTRIVLRTGQPGQAPEEEVISNYDINDYKEKTELTRNKLVTLMYSCLRSYRDIMSLEQNRQGLERVIDASANIFSTDYLENFTHGVLQQVTSILQINDYAFYGKCESLAAKGQEKVVKVVAGTGRFEHIIGQNAVDNIPAIFVSALKKQNEPYLYLHDDDCYMCSIIGKDNQPNILYLQGITARPEIEENLLNIFGKNVLLAFENLYLKYEIEHAQKDILRLLEQQVYDEDSSSSFSNHVENLAFYIAEKLCLPNHFCHQIKNISGLVCFAKQPDHLQVGITCEQHHLTTKAQALKNCQRLLTKDNKLLLAATNSLKQLDEHYDGTGYPVGLLGDQISIETQIAQSAFCLSSLFAQQQDINKTIIEIKKHAGTLLSPSICLLIEQSKKEINKILAGEQT